jgi:Protein of unknown function (DUF3433)
LGFTSLICRPVYNISTKLVSISRSGTLKSIDSSPTPQPHSLRQIKPWDIIAGVNATLSAASTQISRWDVAHDSEVAWVVFDDFFNLLNISAPQKRVTNFLDDALLTEISRRAFSFVAAEIAKQYLLIPTSDTFSGTMNYVEHRLFVHQLSLRAMEAVLALLVILSCVIIFFRPSQVFSRDPGSINGLSTVLSRSPSVETILKGTGATSLATLETLLSGRSYESCGDFGTSLPIFKVQEVSQMSKHLTNTQSGVRNSWWRPFSVTKTARVFTLSMPIILIAALEGTYQSSYRRNGIADIQSDNYIYYIWVYIPASIMLDVRAIFDTVDFSTRLFQPYRVLHDGAAAPQGSIFENYFSKLSIHSLCSGLVRHHFAVASTSLSMLLAPALTMVVSGLYFTTDNIQKSSAVAKRMD